MKIFAISDIHSFYTYMKKALDDAGFEPNNNNHLLVVCGDCFDRGSESQKVLDYLLSVSNKVLVRGNHEDLLVELCQRGYPLSHDLSNGTANTVLDLTPGSQTWNNACAIAMEKVKPLLDQMVNYFETKNYIFVHSFIPLICKDNHVKYHTKNREFEYNLDWRYAHESDWEISLWGNPFELAARGLNQTGKIIVHGHWHNSTGWAEKLLTSEWGKDACFNICEHNGCVGLDACTAYSNFCNVLVIDDEFLEE